MRDHNKINEFPTWCLLGGFVCVCFVHRIIFLFSLYGLSGELPCYHLSDLWRHEKKDFLSIFDQFIFIFGAFFLLAVVEVVRTYLYSWQKRVFVLTVNTMILGSSFLMLISLYYTHQFFEYEKGYLPVERTAFAPDEELGRYASFQPVTFTDEFAAYHRDQCTQRVVYGNFEAELSVRANIEYFERELGPAFNPEYLDFMHERYSYMFEIGEDLIDRDIPSNIFQGKYHLQTSP